ncbi:hypothetical protein BJV78DRAFT_1159251 [Lactifluus subvellereus]|nr:hypothetical protein BJV78DRAFT_1159251 [Lactifluus subvellereus]
MDIECNCVTEDLVIANGKMDQLRNECANLQAEKRIWEDKALSMGCSHLSTSWRTFRRCMMTLSVRVRTTDVDSRVRFSLSIRAGVRAEGGVASLAAWWYDGNISSRHRVTSGGGKSAHGTGMRSRVHGPAVVCTAAEAGTLCNEWACGLSATMMLSPSLIQHEPEGVVHIPCAPPHEDLMKHTCPLSILAHARWWYDGNISSRHHMMSGGGKSAHGTGVRSRVHGPAAVHTAAEAGAMQQVGTWGLLTSPVHPYAQ